MSLSLGIGLGLCFRSIAVSVVSMVLADSVVSSADQTTYTFAGRTLGSGLIIIAGSFRAGSLITLNSLSVAGNSANIHVTSSNGNTSAAFIASAVNAAASGDIVLTFSGTCARLGLAVYLFKGYTETAPYLTATATRTSTAGTMSPNLVGAISKGFVIGAGFNGLAPGHRVGAASAAVDAQTNYNVTVNCQSGANSWTGITEDVDAEMEATGTAVVQAACSAAFR